MMSRQTLDVLAVVAVVFGVLAIGWLTWKSKAADVWKSVAEAYKEKLEERDHLIDDLTRKIQRLENEIDRLKQTDVTALFEFMKAHDAEMKVFVPEVVGALNDVRTALQALTHEIKTASRV